MAPDTKERVTPEGAETDNEFDRIANSAQFDDIMSQPDNADLRDNLNALERGKGEGDNTNENPMNFIRDNVSIADKPPGKNRLFEWLGRNKGAVAGGGSAIILLGGLFTIAAPLKLQGIFSQIEQVTMGRFEGYVNKRVERILFQSLMERFGVGDRNLVKGGSLIKRIAKTMAANKYEERLAAKGLEFSAKDGKMFVRIVGDNTAEAMKLLKKGFDFNNVDDLIKALDGIPVSKKVMKSIISQDLGAWGFFVRGKVARWMLSYFGINRFGSIKTNSTQTPEEKQIAQATESMTNDLTKNVKSVEDGLNLMQNAEKLGNAEKQTASDAARIAAGQAIEDASGVVAAEGKAAMSTSSELLVKVVSKFSEKLGAQLASKIGGAAIGYGEITAAAMAIVFYHWLQNNVNNGNAARALAMPLAGLMGYIYGKWAGYSSQSKEGTLDTDLYNFFNPLLDGVESSSLYNCVDKNFIRGCDNTGEPAYRKINETDSQLFKSLVNLAIYSMPGGQGPILMAISSDYSPVYWLARIIYELDNAVTGWAMDQLLNEVKFGNDLLKSLVPSVGEIEKYASDLTSATATAVFQWALTNVLGFFGLDINSTMQGNKLYDVSLGGAVYTANRFGEMSLDMHKIDYSVVSSQTQQYFADQRELDKDQGVLYALFSPDATNSVTSRLISRTSFGSGGVTDATPNIIASLFGLVKDTPSSLASIATNSASAASFTSPEELENAYAFGITDAEANAPLNAAVFNGGECSVNPITTIVDFFHFDVNSENTTFDNCSLDTYAADSVLCSLDDTIQETPECNPDAGGIAADASATNGVCGKTPGIKSYGEQDGYDKSVTSTKINTCGIEDWPTTFANSAGEYIVEVNVDIADDTAKLAAALKADSEANGNYDYKASLGFRTFKQQQCIYDYFRTGVRGCSDFVTRPKSAAAPGYSNHQMGYSIDLPTNYSCDSPSFKTQVKANEWLDANMKSYGFSRDVGCSDYGHFTHAH